MCPLKRGCPTYSKPKCVLCREVVQYNASFVERPIEGVVHECKNFSAALC